MAGYNQDQPEVYFQGLQRPEACSRDHPHRADYNLDRLAGVPTAVSNPDRPDRVVALVVRRVALRV
jgi:hypothetical protein